MTAKLFGDLFASAQPPSRFFAILFGRFSDFLLSLRYAADSSIARYDRWTSTAVAVRSVAVQEDDTDILTPPADGEAAPNLTRGREYWFEGITEAQVPRPVRRAIVRMAAHSRVCSAG